MGSVNLTNRSTLTAWIAALLIAFALSWGIALPAYASDEEKPSFVADGTTTELLDDSGEALEQGNLSLIGEFGNSAYHEPFDDAMGIDHVVGAHTAFDGIAVYNDTTGEIASDAHAIAGFDESALINGAVSMNAPTMWNSLGESADERSDSAESPIEEASTTDNAQTDEEEQPAVEAEHDTGANADTDADANTDTNADADAGTNSDASNVEGEQAEKASNQPETSSAKHVEAKSKQQKQPASNSMTNEPHVPTPHVITTASDYEIAAEQARSEHEPVALDKVDEVAQIEATAPMHAFWLLFGGSSKPGTPSAIEVNLTRVTCVPPSYASATIPDMLEFSQQSRSYAIEHGNDLYSFIVVDKPKCRSP